jgi:hypothetical protein
MIDHDKHVGELLDLLDELGIADNTIVIYSTDNGPHMNTWPDGGMTPFRNEKNTNWEGAFRIPEMIRWPGKIAAGSISNEIVQHHDWLPTLLAAAGEPDIVEKLKQGHQAGSKTYKVHIDGFNLVPYLTGQEAKSPRKGFFYFSDDGDLLAVRFDTGLGRTVRHAAVAQIVQPSNRSVRACGHHLEHLLGLGRDFGLYRPRLFRRRGAIPGDVQGLSAASEGGQFHHRPGAGKDGSRPGKREALTDRDPASES